MRLLFPPPLAAVDGVALSLGDGVAELALFEAVALSVALRLADILGLTDSDADSDAASDGSKTTEIDEVGLDEPEAETSKTAVTDPLGLGPGDGVNVRVLVSLGVTVLVTLLVIALDEERVTV